MPADFDLTFRDLTFLKALHISVVDEPEIASQPVAEECVRIAKDMELARRILRSGVMDE